MFLCCIYGCSFGSIHQVFSFGACHSSVKRTSVWWQKFTTVRIGLGDIWSFPPSSLQVTWPWSRTTYKLVLGNSTRSPSFQYAIHVSASAMQQRREILKPSGHPYNLCTSFELWVNGPISTRHNVQFTKIHHAWPNTMKSKFILIMTLPLDCAILLHANSTRIRQLGYRNWFPKGSELMLQKWQKKCTSLHVTDTPNNYTGQKVNSYQPQKLPLMFAPTRKIHLPAKGWPTYQLSVYW